MKTPICDFVDTYVKSNTTRLHMPGHKGKSFLGFEDRDLTEIKGADSLYEADGIISESEKNASMLFGCKTYYSTEGSSHCIKAMMYLISIYAKENNTSARILACRNAHKTFVSSAALLDLDVDWIFPSEKDSYLSVTVSAEEIEKALLNANNQYAAVYVTSPDYLGNTSEIKEIANVCHKYNVLLVVDNAHGAYLGFLENNMHPISLGADICCDSAHKTLPVLTGGAYMHLSDKAPTSFFTNAKNALSLFGSTSPSYLILQSLDKANIYLEKTYKTKLTECTKRVALLKKSLTENGYTILINEPLKITLQTKPYGYNGNDLADILRKNLIECEFSDPDYLVLMFTPELSAEEFEKIESTLLSVPKKAEITVSPPKTSRLKRVMSIRNAIFSPSEYVNAEDSEGRIIAFSNVGCPPAVPIAVSGEIIDQNSIECFKYYGIDKCCVVK